MFHDETYLRLPIRLAAFFLVVAATTAHASRFSPYDSKLSEGFSEYYTLDEKTEKARSMFQAPAELVAEGLHAIEIQRSDSISLLGFIFHNRALPAPAEKYSRKDHFGSWRSARALGCFDVRGMVLARTSSDPVQTHLSGNRCVVDSGRWDDPYTGQTFTSTKDIQIDHVVALKNAYIMGGWKWKKEKKCWYANFIANKHHLLPVSGHENMSKSDETPADYMPPNPSYQCDYLKIWLKIKMTWKLALVGPEVEAIQNLMQKNGCDPRRYTITVNELERTRQDIENNSPLCL